MAELLIGQLLTQTELVKRQVVTITILNKTDTSHPPTPKKNLNKNNLVQYFYM